MNEAAFVHYVVCEDCKQQLRIDAPADWVTIVENGRVIGVRCCDVVYVNQGFTVGRISVRPPVYENSAKEMCE